MTNPRLLDVLDRVGLPTRVSAGAQSLSAEVENVCLFVQHDVPPAGSLLVHSWTAARKAGALPALEPIVTQATASAAAGLIVTTGDRRVSPPPNAIRLADLSGLPLIWLDDPMSAADLTTILADARAELVQLDADRRIVLLEALATLLSEGVNPESALRAARVLPVLAVRIVDLATGSGEPLVEWSAGSEQVQSRKLLVALGSPGAPADTGSLELVCARELTTRERAYVDSLATLLTLWLSARRGSFWPTPDHVQDDLLAAILGSDLAARETAIRRSRRLGVFPNRRSVVLVVEPFGHRLTAVGLKTLARNVTHTVRLRDSKSSVLAREGGILVIVGEDIDQDRLVHDIVRMVGVPVCVGVSTTVTSIDRLPGGYRQARRSTTLAQQLGQVNMITRYSELGFYRLLVLLPEHERSRFVSEVLGPLANEGSEQADLRRTLRVVGENRGNIKAAAERLFIHPNTLRQRIHKLSQLLGPFLEDADTYLNVYLALALHRLKDRDPI